MKVLAVDDERLALKALGDAVRAAVPGEEVLCLSCAEDALEYARTEQVDVAFLDIEMGEMDGIALAQRLKLMQPRMNIVFVTGYSHYMGDAFDLHASGYALKPVTAQRIAAELEHLRYQPASAPAPGVRVRCFGGFGIWVNGALFNITRARPRELLAFLVHKRGASVTAAQIAAVLWEDRPYTRSVQSQVQTVISQLRRTLREAGIEDMLIRKWNCLAVDPAKFTCDYYEFLSGGAAAINRYCGQYLEEYSWAEMTVGALEGD